MDMDIDIIVAKVKEKLINNKKEATSVKKLVDIFSKLSSGEIIVLNDAMENLKKTKYQSEANRIKEALRDLVDNAMENVFDQEYGG